MPNRLINETSPYLLQHAHNPVDWYPWGEEALEKAKKENKPILVSIGYSACHWCHVMERESFERKETAELMNEHFVNIKIDREERPDLDHIYMDAVQAMTWSGGWPLNVFLTPEKKPFYGGTYFPPKRAFNRASWTEILTAISNAFREKRNEIDSQAETLTEHLLQSNSFGIQQAGNKQGVFTKGKIDDAFNNLMQSADTEWGGFGNAPKFPQTFSIQFLLRYYYETNNEKALTQACLSLDKMIEGGIYDQLGGGFARYSTDKEWLAPHFEKMLYDNALLISVLCEAFQSTKNERYKDIIDETIDFVQRELMHPGGGFYSALDADSEGEEGKYYTWTYEEVTEILKDNAGIFCEYFDITKNGNWEGKNILRSKKSLEIFAVEKNIAPGDLVIILQKNKSLLFSERSKRVRPMLDDKIILGWNALMNTACSKAFCATGNEEYRQLALRNMQFLLSNFRKGDQREFRHSWKNSEAKSFAFLDDYALLAESLLHLQEVTGDVNWLLEAKAISKYLIDNFSEEKTGFFFFTDIVQEDVIIRKKEVYDGATPSGNATMAYTIYRLSILFDLPEWQERSRNMVSSLTETIIRYPTSFGIWANMLMEIIYGTDEIAVVGNDPVGLANRVLGEYIPHKVFMFSAIGNEDLPLMRGKSMGDSSLIYLCKAYSCLKPVGRVEDLLKAVNIRNKN